MFELSTGDLILCINLLRGAAQDLDLMDLPDMANHRRALASKMKDEVDKRTSLPDWYY